MIWELKGSMGSKGVSCTELMCVFAIIGILSSFSGYLKKTYIAEAFNTAAITKNIVANFYLENGMVYDEAFSGANSGHPLSLNHLYGMDDSDKLGTLGTKHIFIGPRGIIIMVFNGKVQDDAVLALVPSFSRGTLTWDCVTDLYGALPLETKYLPQACR